MYQYQGSDYTRPTRIFTRKKFQLMCYSCNPENYGLHFTPAALSMMHQVYETHLINQLLEERSPLRQEISIQNLKWENKRLNREKEDADEENKRLNREKEDLRNEKKRKRSGESLQP